MYFNYDKIVKFIITNFLFKINISKINFEIILNKKKNKVKSTNTVLYIVLKKNTRNHLGWLFKINKHIFLNLIAN